MNHADRVILVTDIDNFDVLIGGGLTLFTAVDQVNLFFRDVSGGFPVWANVTAALRTDATTRAFSKIFSINPPGPSVVNLARHLVAFKRYARADLMRGG
jgi:hypothetical protein